MTNSWNFVTILFLEICCKLMIRDKQPNVLPFANLCAPFRSNFGAWEVNSKYDVTTTDSGDCYLDTFADASLYEFPLLLSLTFSFICSKLTNWHELKRFLSTLMVLQPYTELQKVFLSLLSNKISEISNTKEYKVV